MKQIWTLVLAGLICWCPTGAAAHETGTPHVHDRYQEGLDTAGLWLGLMDKGAYAAAWQTAARVVRTQITAGQWEKTVGAARNPMGRLVERRLFHHRFVTTLPGMPDGRYLVIRYKTRFENKDAAVETVTLVQGPEDDIWRGGGYFIR